MLEILTSLLDLEIEMAIVNHSPPCLCVPTMVFRVDLPLTLVIGIFFTLD